MTKAFELPDIAPAATSDIGVMARRLIEHADLTTIPPLLDALEAAGRQVDVHSLKDSVVQAANTGTGPTPPRMWRHYCQSLIHLFWFDLFTLDGTLSVLESVFATDEKAAINEDDGTFSAGAAMTPDGYAPPAWVLIAEQDIPAGSRVEIHHREAVVRLAPPEPVTEEGV